MKFQHENTILGNKHSCTLDCNKCTAQNRSGRRCNNTVCIGTPVCHVHRKSLNLGVKVGNSRIPNAGKGLFATKVFKEKEVIGFYDGRDTTQAELDDRYGVDSTAPYIIKGKDGIYLDAACLRSLMSVANSGTSRKGRILPSNAKFSSKAMGNGTVKVSATKRINVNDEILIWYGEAYFNGMPFSRHSTKR
jgi:hypothetical protein